MQDQIQEIKQKIDIVEFIAKYLPDLKKRGRHWTARCPFHQEKSPSFIVSPELQIYKCFGCGKGGDVFNFWQEFEKVDFKESLAELAKIAGVKLVSQFQNLDTETQKQQLISLNSHLANFYNYVLTTHPLGKNAREYLQDRGITSETIKKFKIGFSPQSSDQTVKYLLKQKFKTQNLIDSGTFLTGHSGLFDRFSGRLVFPLFDYRSRPLGFSGRLLPQSNQQKYAKYINSPETILYHKSQMLFGINFAKEAIKKEKFAVVVEGEFDMISPYQNGFQNFVALKGTAFTQEQLLLLKRYTESLVLGLDTDFAGNHATLKSILLAESLGFDLKVLILPANYKDPDEAIQADSQAFQKNLLSAIPVWDFVINSSVKQFGTGSNLAKKQIMTQVLPLLNSISNSIIRQDYFKKLAIELETDWQLLESEAQKINQKTSFSTPQTTSSPATFHESRQSALIKLILGAKSPQAVAKQVAEKLDLSQDIPENIILKNLTEYTSAHDFAQLLPPEILPLFQQLYLHSESQNLDSIVRAKQIQDLKNLILKDQLQQHLKKIRQLLAKSELYQDENQTAALEQDYNLTLKKLSRLN